MKTKIIVKESVLIKDIPTLVKDKIIQDLTYTNPDYSKRLRIGAYIPPDLEKYVKLFSPFGTGLFVPRGYMNKLLSLLQKGNYDYEIIDRTAAPEISLNLISTSRNYQVDAVKDLLKYRYGLLEAPTGAGKTFCSIYYTTERKVRTLVVVHTKELLKQWVEAFKTHTDIKQIGIIGDGKFDIQDVTIGLVKSVDNKIKDIKGLFGLLVCDECHRVVSDMWARVINSVNCKYQLSVSATPYRSDGLTSAIFVLTGPRVHKIDKNHLENIKAILVPKVIQKYTKFNYDFRSDYSSLLKKLTENTERNKIIAATILEDLNAYNEPIMVVSDRITHCEELFALLSSVNAKPVVINGRQSNETRKVTIEGLRNGTYNILIATASLLGEGFDAPMLSALVMGTPIKFDGRLIQLIGRILRPSKSEVMPRVYDFRDNLVKVLQFQGFHRDKLYKKAGWK